MKCMGNVLSSPLLLLNTTVVRGKSEESGLRLGIVRFEQYSVAMDKVFYVLFRLVEKDQKTLGGRKLALSVVP